MFTTHLNNMPTDEFYFTKHVLKEGEDDVICSQLHLRLARLL